MEEISEQTIELRVLRHVGQGVHEELDFTNFTQKPAEFRFQLELDADFADQGELQQGKREQQGNVQREWRQTPDGLWELSFDYMFEHAYGHFAFFLHAWRATVRFASRRNPRSDRRSPCHCAMTCLLRVWRSLNPKPPPASQS